MKELSAIFSLLFISYLMIFVSLEQLASEMTMRCIISCRSYIDAMTTALYRFFILFWLTTMGNTYYRNILFHVTCNQSSNLPQLMLLKQFGLCVCLSMFVSALQDCSCGLIWVSRLYYAVATVSTIHEQQSTLKILILVGATTQV